MLKPTYIYEQAGWPELSIRHDVVLPVLGNAKFAQGKIAMQFDGLSDTTQSGSTIDSLVSSVMSSSRIEGVTLQEDDVYDSIFRGVPADRSRQEAGIAEIALDIKDNALSPLTKERILQWHEWLFCNPEPWFDRPMLVGQWRDDRYVRMKVISRIVGDPEVRFVAPPAEQVDEEVDSFVEYFNKFPDDWLIKAAIAHLWFEVIHPFEDGNGRIGRAIADLAIARSTESPQFINLSRQILKRRKNYYSELDRASRGGLDITRWVCWFIKMVEDAIYAQMRDIESLKAKDEFWTRNRDVVFNKRQLKVLGLMLSHGFVGKMSANKWARMTKTSRQTAWRDINALIEKDLLVERKEGRKIRYEIASGARG